MSIYAWNLTLVGTDGSRIPAGLPMLVSVLRDGESHQTAAAIWPDPVNPGRAQLIFPDNLPDGNAFTVTLYVKGYAPLTFRCDYPRGVYEAVAPPAHPCVDPTPLPGLEPSAIPFPPSGKRTPLPPFDPSDSGGEVHTTPPPEFAPPPVPNVLWFRADFNGHCIDMDRWGTPPMLSGANSTPINMLMTPMAPLYPSQFQQAIFTEHAEIGYTHFISSHVPWNAAANGRSDWSPQDTVDWLQKVRSAGFFNVLWYGNRPDVNDPFVMAAVQAGLVDFLIVGGEVDDKMTAEEYEAVLDWYVANTSVPLGAHFTANYPTEFPRDTFITNWSKYDGRVHLCWQANCSDPNQKGFTAGGQGSMLYYARQRVNLGLQGGDGRPAPNSRVIAFEIMSFAQLLGNCTEDYGNLRSLQLLWCPQGITTRGVDGFGSGARYPDGSVI